MYKRRLVAVLLVGCILATQLPLNFVEEYEASDKVGTVLLNLLKVTYEELVSGDFIDSGGEYSCIIWVADVEIEKAVKGGIDAAEMTRENYSVRSRYDYPYTIMKKMD